MLSDELNLMMTALSWDIVKIPINIEKKCFTDCRVQGL